MSFADNIKAKIKDVDVEKQLTELVDEGEKLVNDAVTKAGDIAHDKRGDVEGWLDKATGAINEKTEGKYADKVTRVRDTLLGGLDKLAQRRTSDAADASDAGSTDPVPLPPAPPAAVKDPEAPDAPEDTTTGTGS
ncbi:Rv0909 family putative TA system antitoxin [Nocardioides daphniae]|nr:Rv0909 family putative TA system antitoxin [Nocardioides daphniae]GGD09662.1 hypothetical protein GCM10007231_05640 [Nocardioides daphniae]